MITPELLRAAGECLHGAHWQVALAKDVGVSDRQMRRWKNAGAPDFVIPVLVDLLNTRTKRASDTAKALKASK